MIEVLLAEYNVTDYEITDMRNGHGQITIFVYGRFIHDPEAFEKIGYRIVNREARG